MRLGISKSRTLLLLVLGLLLLPTSEAQQSYRSYQQLSGRVLNNATGSKQKIRASRAKPMRFKGWNYPGKYRSDYLAHFSRPRASVARAELLKNAARAAALNTSRSAQFVPSALPGILLRPSLPTGYIPSAIASGDFNGDGKLDFVVANGGDNTLWLYFGKGDGTFNLPVIVPVTLGQSPVWIAAGDLRGIGRTDLIVAESDSNSVGIFLNNGDGTFVESVVALPDSATFLLVSDFNHDGKLDIVAPMDDDNSNVYIAMLPGLGNGMFGSPIITPLDGYTPEIFWASSSDLNADGLPDLVLSSAQPDISIQVYLNNGNGTFTAGEVVAQSYEAELLGSVLFDANGDGKTDVIFADAFGALWVYDGNGDGTFNTTNPGMSGIGDVVYGIAAADVNGDGNLDVVASGVFVNDLAQYGTEAGDQICVLEGDGKGNFSYPKVYRGDSSSYSLAVGDFRGNGFPDAVTANQDNDSVSVFLNDGLGGFGSPNGNWIGYEGGGAVNAPMSGALMADVDGNGTTDVAFLEWEPPSGTDNYYQLTVLLNDGSGNLSAPIRSDALNFLFGDWVLADFRNTGKPDFLVISENYNSKPNSYSFVPNSGNGHFGPVTETNSTNANGVLGVGDFNGDGKLDFVAAGHGINNQPLNGIAVFLGNGDGTFQTGSAQNFGSATEPNPVAVYVGDFNRDGKLDLLVLLEGNGGFLGEANLYEFLGNGDGTFQAGKLLIPNIGPMTVADLNGDGYADIVSMAVPYVSPLGGAPTPAQFSIYIGEPDGTFLLTNTYTPYVGGGAFPEQPYSPIFGKYTPMVADFNGDGNLDIAAFQQYGENYTGGANADTFVQFLLGNGDGTFTPTYEIFDFRKTLVTAYAADLMGTGRSDLFELNGYRSTYNILPNIVAPAFQFALLEDPVPPTQGSGMILLDVAVATPTKVSLTSSDPAIQVPSTVTVPAGSISQTFTFNIGSAFNSQHGFAITAVSGSTSVTVIGTVSGTATFQTNGAMIISLAAGQTDSSLGQIITSVNGYSGTVSTQCFGLSAVGQCTFTPPSLTVHPGQVSDGSMSFAALPNAAQGTYSGTLQTTDGATTQTSPITINIGDYTMSLSPQSLQLLPDGSGSYQLTVGSINQFNQIVNLTCSGLPGGATCSTYPGWTRPPTGASPVPIPVQLQSLPIGNYTITVSGSSPPLTHTATAQLQVSDFATSASPSTLNLSEGGSTPLNVTVSPVNGFDGSVNLSCSSSTALSCSFNPATVTVPANGNGTSAVTVTAASSVQQGNYQLTISGTSQQVAHTATVQVQVGPDFTASVSPTSATVSAGGSANFNVTVSSANGFSGNVNFGCSSLSAISCSFNPSSVTVPANGTGASVLTVTASSQSLQRSLRDGRVIAGFVVTIWGLTIGAFLVTKPKKGMVVPTVLLLSLTVCAILGCGGGDSSSGGGGIPPQTYTINVQFNTANGTPQTAGTITLTVN